MSQVTSLSDAPAGESFESLLRDRVRAVRGALTELYAAVDADPAAPQVVSRTFGINRNLAWKLSKVINADEPLATVEHLPKASAVEILLAAFAEAGAPDTAIDRVRTEMEAFDAAIDEHLGDRGLLELIVGPMLPRHLQVDRDRAARRLSFRGNSATWGIQAEARLSMLLIAPNADDPDFVDFATVGGLVGYRRLRGGIRWPLLRLHSYRDDGSAIAAVPAPLDPDIAPDEVPLLREFCTGDQPPIVTREIPGGRQFEIGEGPLGNRGRVTSLFGQVARRVAHIWQQEEGETGEQLVLWSTPVEHALVDMVVHRDLPFEMPPTVSVFGRMTPGTSDPVAARGAEPIPLAETLQSLGEGPPQFATPVIPFHRRLTESIFDRLGWDARDFAAWRLVVPYPPIPAIAMLRFPLGRRD